MPPAPPIPTLRGVADPTPPAGRAARFATSKGAGISPRAATCAATASCGSSISAGKRRRATQAQRQGPGDVASSPQSSRPGESGVALLGGCEQLLLARTFGLPAIEIDQCAADGQR